MALDPARASFVTQPHRYLIVTDTTVSAKYPAAQILTIDTNLTEASANTLKTQLEGEAMTPAQVVTLQIEGVLSIDDFAGGVPRFILEAPSMNLSGKTMKLVSMKVDHNTNRTELTVRG